MARIALLYGLIAGALVSGMMVVTLPLITAGTLHFDQGEILGYSTMVLSFLLVFFGIRSYREHVAGGTITFGKAFQVGILITLVACAMYVVTWEILYFNFLPDFLDRYDAHMVAKMRAAGDGEAAIQAAQKKMAGFKKLYANPFFNAAVTFMEIFPVGLVVTLVSAAILRRKGGPQASLATG